MRLSMPRTLALVLLVLVVVALVAEAGRDRSRTRRPRKRKPLKFIKDLYKKAAKKLMKHVKPKHPNKRVDPDKFLEHFGYLRKLHLNVQHSHESRKAAIRNFQRMVGAEPSGLLDDDTREMMLAPRCGMADVTPEGENIAAKFARDPVNTNPSSYYVPGYKWEKTDLQWRALGYSRDLGSETQRRAFYDAFKLWSDVTPLKFREISSGNPDIEISFGSREHGDGAGNAFDGEGGVLAHAFYPDNGDTHFDEDEQWTDGTDQGTNLKTVAAHEFGHALGLGHSNVEGALMAPYYQGYDPNLKLHDDDIRAMQSIYGVPSRTSPTTTPRPRTTTRRAASPTTTLRPTTPKPYSPTTKPDSCTTKFDAVYQDHDYSTWVFRGAWAWRLGEWGVDAESPYLAADIFPSTPTNTEASVHSPSSHYTYFFKAHDNKIYVFKERWLWRLSDYGKDAEFPRGHRKYFLRAPYNMNAAVYSYRTRYTYFFKGLKVFKYWGFQYVQHKTVQTAGYPEAPQAVFMAGDGIIYLLKGANYWQFDETRMDVRSATPRPISSKWPGVTPNQEAAVRLRDGYVYFFKGTNYRKFDERTRRVMAGYPKAKAAPWMGEICGGKWVPK